MVTGIATLCVRLPLLPVTVTVPFNGVGVGPPPLLLPPPQETKVNNMPSSKRLSRLLRHALPREERRRGFIVKTIPSEKTRVP